MPKYRVVEKSFIEGSLREEGEVIEFSGENPGKNLDPADKEAEAVKKGLQPKVQSENDLKRQKESIAGVESKDLSQVKPDPKKPSVDAPLA